MTTSWPRSSRPWPTAPAGDHRRSGRRGQDPARDRGGRAPDASVPGGVWLVRLDAVDAPPTSPGGRRDPPRPRRRAGAVRAAVRGRTMLLLDNCEHVVGRGPLAGRSPARRGARRSGAGHQPGAAGARGGAPPSARAADQRRRGAALHPTRPGSGTAGSRSTATGRRSSRGVPLARRAAAGHRARRGPRCARCRCRTSPGDSTTGSPCSATPAATGPNAGERWRARSPGATTCCSPTTSAGCGPCPASPAARRWTPWSM